MIRHMRWFYSKCILVLCACSVIITLYILSKNYKTSIENMIFEHYKTSFKIIYHEHSEISTTRNVLSKYRGKSHHHGLPQLMSLRTVILERFGINLMSMDPFNMTALYRFMPHILLGHPPGYHPSVRKQCVVYSEKIQILRRSLDKVWFKNRASEGQFITRQMDIYGRGCNYNPHDEYQYSFTTHFDDGYLYIKVTELATVVNKSMPKGNNIFGVVKTKISVSVCDQTDYYDNTYVFVCPILENNFQVELSATYVSIVRNTFKCSRGTWVLKTYTNSSFQNTTIQRTNNALKQSMYSTCRDSKGHEKGFWLKIGSFFYWSTGSCHYPYTFTPSQVQCLNETSIIMFGDSHTFDRTNAIKHVYGKQKITQPHSLNSVELLCNILKVYTSFLNGKAEADVIVMNAGAHDFAFADLIAYIATMSEIFKVMTLFSQLQKPPKVIWVETTPVGNNGFHRGAAANNIIEACNTWINHKLKEIGVVVIHAFDIAITMTSKNRGDGQHYFHYLGHNVKNASQINVGGAVTSVIVHEVCPLE